MTTNKANHKQNNTNSLDLSRRQLLKAGAGAAALSMLPFSKALGAFSNSPTDDLTWMPGWQLTDHIASKKLSPVEVTKHFLNRIDQFNPIIKAYITVDHEGALAQAKECEAAVMRGEKLGPLHGMPVSIKDLYDTKGLRTTQGSMIYKDHIPDRDEILVERLRNAGAIIIGKSQTSEFATFPRTKTELAGECVNPWNTKHITGASSGGSGAAVAAGMSCFSIGSDGGGSTRIPACYNGVFGLQPSAGRLPSLLPKSVHMSSAGPMTQHVRDSAMLIQVMSGKDPRDPSAIESVSPNFTDELDKGIKDFRIAWTKDWGVIPNIDNRVIQGVESSVALFKDAGAHVDAPNITLPDKEAWQVFLTLNETSYHRGSRLLDFNEDQIAQLTPPTKAMYEVVKSSPSVTKEDEIAALKLRASVQRWMDGVFANHDLICTPTLGIAAPSIPEGEWEQPYKDPFYASHISTCYTYIANILGLPAASVPCGFVDGLPIGMQIIGKRFDDVKVMRTAQAFSKIKPWMHKHPAQFS